MWPSTSKAAKIRRVKICSLGSESNQRKVQRVRRHCTDPNDGSDMADLFWLSDAQWERIEPHLPLGRCGARRVDDRRVLSGIVHMLPRARWRDTPGPYGPPTTIYTRFHRWSQQGVWQAIFDALVSRAPAAETAAIDATHARAHRSAAGGRGDRPSAAPAAAESRSCMP